MKINNLVLIIVVLVIVGIVAYNLDNPTETKPSQVTTTTESKNSKPTNKTDTEAIVDGSVETAKILVSAIEEGRENKLRKDSIRKANRKNRWVYQIGLPTNNSSHLLTTYNQLHNISNIKVFKSGRKSYFIYKDDGYNEKQIKDSLASLQAKLSETGNKVEIIDLMSLCTLKENIARGEDIKIKKEDVVNAALGKWYAGNEIEIVGLLCNTCN